MGGIGLFKQGWRWVQSHKQAYVSVRVAASYIGERLVLLLDRHWPLAYSWYMVAGGFFLGLLLQWRDSVVGGLRSLFTLGSAALFVITWSCFLCLTSTASLAYVLLCLVAAAKAIHHLRFMPGLIIVGFYGILLMYIYGYFWITTMLLIAGGYMFSLSHARFLILMATGYALYFVMTHVGLYGVFLSLNLSFVCNDILNKLLQGYDGIKEDMHFKEQKEPEPVMEDFSDDNECFPPSKEDEETAASKSSCALPKTLNLSNKWEASSSSKVVMTESTSLVEMKRIMDSSNHYEVLGVVRNKNVDPEILKKEYRKKVLLVHPDKNLGSPLACESFKKLQCAYEVLSDLTRKKNYDEKLRMEESGRTCQRSSAASQQGGEEYQSEESRRIECTKCGNSHIWICTTRSKGSARWCQGCSQYHQAKDGEGWIESGCSLGIMKTSGKVEIPRAFVCAESKIFDVSEWAICQGMECRPNTHGPTFHVNMVGLDRTGFRSNSSRYPWGLDAEMIVEDDEFELWLQQAVASGIFSESPKRRRSWPFKINQRGMKPWRKSS